MKMTISMLSKQLNPIAQILEMVHCFEQNCRGKCTNWIQLTLMHCWQFH